MTNIQIQLSKLNPGETLRISPHGYSMYPFVCGNRDDVFVCVPDFPLKRGDIALYDRSNGEYVAHRVYRVTTNNGVHSYYLLGDHQTLIEGPLAEECIHGVVVALKRKGKYIDCNENKLYIFLSKLWLLIRPIRPVFFFLLKLIRH